MIEILGENRRSAWGSKDGSDVYIKLRKIVNNSIEYSLFLVSLKGVEITDASFARESYLRLVKEYRLSKGFALKDFDNSDIFDNWDAAAQKFGQSSIVWNSSGSYDLIGEKPTKGVYSMLDFVMQHAHVTAGMAAIKMGISVQNASNKLKHLFVNGLIMRNEIVAESGGIEFQYYRIG